MSRELKILVIVFAFLLTSCGQKQKSQFISPEVTTNTIGQVDVDTTENREIRFYNPICEYIEMTARDTAALELANRVVGMYTSIDYSVADNVWTWAEATDTVVWQYAEGNSIQYDTAVVDLHQILARLGYAVESQWSMNTYEDYMTVIRTYDAVMAYKRLINDFTDMELKQLVRAEYNAWFEWIDAEYFTFVYGVHGNDRYTMLPLEYGEFHSYHTENRLEALRVERDILTQGKTYRQQGQIVTVEQWNQWLDEQGYREDMSPDFNMDEPTETDFPALIKDKTERWLAARHAVSAYLGTKKVRGQSYDNLTADIHACIIGTLNPPVEMLEIIE